MPNMQEIESKDLVLRITGEVQSSNLVEFEKTALEVIASINLDLVTDDDFAEAEQNIKSCSLIETRIHNARQDALTSTADIAALITTTERLEAKFRKVRLDLNSKVKSEKEKRKNEIISKAKESVTSSLSESPVKDFFNIDFKAIQDAVKNKRSLAKMQEAIDEVVEEEHLRLEEMEQNYNANTATIEEAAKEYPGLFPDIKNLALSPLEVVAAQISSRIATYKYEIELKEKAAKEEEERLTKEALEKKAAQAKEEEDIEVAVEEEPLPPPPFPADDFTPEPPMTHTAAVLIVTKDLDGVLRRIRDIPGVVSVD